MLIVVKTIAQVGFGAKVECAPWYLDRWEVAASVYPLRAGLQTSMPARVREVVLRSQSFPLSLWLPVFQ